MANEVVTDATNIRDGLPRRKAIQGVAGALAGIAALGAVESSAKKKKNKKNKKGTLVRFETAEQTQSIPTAVPTTVTATCPKAGNKEQVFVTGGGYKSTQTAISMIAITSQATSNEPGWEVTFFNNVTAQDVTVSAICAYFRKK